MSSIIPAVLPSSRKDLEEKLAIFAHIPTVSRVQIDVVDGRFASPASWPYTAPQELRDMLARGEMLPHLDRFAYEIDLLCLDAESAGESWIDLGASRLTLHAESFIRLPQSLTALRERHGDIVISFGLALNIASDLSLIEPYLDQIDYVQFMGIATIGRQGQRFDRRVLEKVRAFRLRHPLLPVQVDGGVTLETARELLALGVTGLVVGSAILRASDPSAAFAKFEALHISPGA